MPAIPISRSAALALASVLLAILVVAGPRLARTGTAASAEAPVAAPVEEVTPSPARRALVVHVVGAVRRPGLFRLPDGTRVADAVARAGGATRRADLAGLNLAAPLVDGTQVLVPVESRAATAASAATSEETPAAGAAAPDAAKVSLSSATVDELDHLPGVGPVTAQKIVDHRTAHGPFASVDDLDAVPGIGPARLEQLRELVTP